MTGPQNGPNPPQHPWEDPEGFQPGQLGAAQPVPYTGPPVAVPSGTPLITTSDPVLPHYTPVPLASQPSQPPAPPVPHSGSAPVSAVPAPQAAPVKPDWTYGLPPGVRPDLLKSPLGQHGAMAGSVWQRRGQRGTPFVTLVLVELRKLLGTMSDRLLLAISPLVLVLVTWYAADGIQTAPPSAASLQIFGLIVACQIGPVVIYTVVLKTLCGEWHYRSVQLTLLLQPRRARYVLAQCTAILMLWLVIGLIQFSLYYEFKSAQIRSSAFQDYLGPRPMWVLAVALLGGFLSLLFLLCIGFLVRNPTAAVTVYLVLSVLYLFRVLNPPVLSYVDPWQPASLLAGTVTSPFPTITSATLLFGTVLTGFVLFARRDAS